MKASLIKTLKSGMIAGGLLAALVCQTAQGEPETVDWKKDLMTVAERKRHASGKLLPLQSYDETIRRGMSFILDDHLKWFKGPLETLTDENGDIQMPWVYYSNVQHNGAPFPRAVDRFTSYPAFHHALNIKTFLGYWRYADDERALEEAIKLADWDIAHSTPSDWAYGSMPYSTFEHKKPGGFRDGSGIMPDKAAILSLAYLDLYEACNERRFLKAAEAIARTLSKRQRPNGTWPFRVDPQTERVVEEYTSSVIYAVMLFERLDQLNGNQAFRPYRDKTWNWLVNGPIKTKEFRGFYEDIPPSPQGRTNYDCLDTIRYLLANRTAENGYLEMAKDLNAWIEKIFLDQIRGFEPAEGIREQLQCNYVMGIHSLNWASMLYDLAEATGDEQMRQRAIQTANYTTYYLQPDNRIVVGFDYKQFWYSCHVGVILYLFDFDEFKLEDLGDLDMQAAGCQPKHLGDLDVQAPATITFTLKTDRAQADGRILSQLEGADTQAGALRVKGTTLQLWNGRNWLTAVTGLNVQGKPQQIAVVFEANGTVRAYLNGQQGSTIRSSFDFKGVQAGFRAPFLGQYGSPFVGELSDFQVTKRALNEDEL
jgi:hypothetical protein